MDHLPFARLVPMTVVWQSGADDVERLMGRVEQSEGLEFLRRQVIVQRQAPYALIRYYCDRKS